MAGFPRANSLGLSVCSYRIIILDARFAPNSDTGAFSGSTNSRNTGLGGWYISAWSAVVRGAKTGIPNAAEPDDDEPDDNEPNDDEPDADDDDDDDDSLLCLWFEVDCRLLIVKSLYICTKR
jgi:hypothetical protein